MKQITVLEQEVSGKMAQSLIEQLQLGAVPTRKHVDHFGPHVVPGALVARPGITETDYELTPVSHR